ncbi:MAG: histidine kinase, partial [Bacteroidota bacterium]
FTNRLETHLQDKLDERSLKFMERIHVATDRMFIMIDGVLMYSTINEGRQKPGPVDLNEVLKSIETDLEVAL